MNTEKNDTQKQDFLTMLTSMDKDQINQFIKEHGKAPKRINPIIKYTNNSI